MSFSSTGRALLALSLLTLASCAGRDHGQSADISETPLWMEVCPKGDSTLVVSISPFDGTRDTLVVTSPLENVVCMSSTQVAGFCSLDAREAISGVSGVSYLADSTVRANAFEAGYEGSMDYERIVTSGTGLVLGYMTSAVEPEYFGKLRKLGIRVFPVHEHLEHHPLARAAYLKMYGALAGKSGLADELFSEREGRYRELRSEAKGKHKILINIPYGDMWYIPSRDNYMSILIRDAGGEIQGTAEGITSPVISIEEAYVMAREAEFWLHPGQCSSKADMIASNASFKSFPLERMKVWNNTAATGENGGNDFWESGAVRPDLVLEDLVAIFSEDGNHQFKYYRKVE